MDRRQFLLGAAALPVVAAIPAPFEWSAETPFVVMKPGPTRIIGVSHVERIIDCQRAMNEAWKAMLAVNWHEHPVLDEYRRSVA